MAGSPYITVNEKLSPIRNFTEVGANPANKIEFKGGRGSLSPVTYPPDLGKYRFVILGADVDITYNLDFNEAFVLPLPYGLTEQHTTHYDTNFNLTDAAAKAVGDVVGSPAPGLGAAVGGAMGAIGAVTGLHINQMKWVTLKNPEFNRHQFAWKFSPKTYEESKTIRKIVYDLKSGMVVRKTYGPGSGFVFGFPKIYSMFFMPNMQFLYKFKPCVLQNIKVDYQGGNPAPAFFNDQTFNEPGAVGMDGDAGEMSPSVLNPNRLGRGSPFTVTGDKSYSPPESIIIHTTWLELEIWTDADFKGKMESSDPFDVYSWYGAR